MAAAQMKKTALLEDQNMLLLMTMPDDKITTVEAREYLRLRRGDELKKLRRKLTDEEERERLDAASEATERGRSSATKRRRHVQVSGDQYEGEGSQGVRCGDGFAAGMATGRSADGVQEGTASQAAEDDESEGEGDYCVSLSEGGRDGCCDGEGGEQVAAGHEGRGSQGFGAAGATPNEEMDGWESN
jgi:hypothetical protein